MPKRMYDRDTYTSVGSRFLIPGEKLLSPDGGKTENGSPLQTFHVQTENGRTYEFTAGSSFLYVFKTLTAFLCLRICFSDIGALDAICAPGYAVNPSVFSWMDG